MDLQTARGVASRIWGDPDYAHVAMNHNLAERIAIMLMVEANTQAMQNQSAPGLFEEQLVDALS